MALFGKRVRPQQFRYIPQYWDPVKEEREARRRRMEQDNEPNAVKDRISYAFKHPRRSVSHSQRHTHVRSNIILFVSIALLSYLAYRLITGNLAFLEKWLG